MNEKLQIEQIGAHFLMKNVSYEPFRRCSLHPILGLSSESCSLLDLPLQDQSVVPPSFWRKADFCWCRQVSGSVSPFPIDFTLLHFLCFGTGSDRVAAVCVCGSSFSRSCEDRSRDLREAGQRWKVKSASTTIVQKSGIKYWDLCWMLNRKKRMKGYIKVL